MKEDKLKDLMFYSANRVLLTKPREVQYAYDDKGKCEIKATYQSRNIEMTITVK